MVERWKGLLFLHGTPPSEIDKMDYFDLRYWGEVVEIALEAKQKILDDLRRGR